MRPDEWRHEAKRPFSNNVDNDFIVSDLTKTMKMKKDISLQRPGWCLLMD